MKLQLVNAPLIASTKFGEISQNMWPPLAIMYLASYLRKNLRHKIEIKLTDGLLEGFSQTSKIIDSYGPDIMAVSSLTSNVTGAYKIINQAKKQNPNLFVITGGVHASALPEDIFKRSETDLIIVGEGEQTFLEVIKSLLEKKSFSNIRGLALRKDGQILTTKPRGFIHNLDQIPFPAHDLLENRDKYVGWFFKKQKPETAIMSTRGCPFNCYFCANIIWKSGKPWLRMRSPKNVVDELEWLVKDYGTKEYFDVADEFNCSIPWALEVCDEIIKHKLNLTWKCQLRADRVTEELAKKMAKAGCWYIHLGAESGNQKTLDGIGKKITPDQVEESARILKKYGIKVDILLMLFNIWEEKGKLQYEGVRESLQTLAFADHLKKKKAADFIGWSPTTPYPGSQLFRTARKYNLIKKSQLIHWERWNNVWGMPAFLPGISKKDYMRVKTRGTLIQLKYVFSMRKYINFGNFIDLSKRILALLLYTFENLKRAMK